MSKTFEELHPDVIKHLPTVKQYRNYTLTGRVIEAWDKDNDGVWHDVTLREQAIEQAKRELAMAKRLAKAMEATDGN
jgi:hypothetical protein